MGLGILLALSFFYRGFSYSRIVVVSFVSIIFCLNFFSRHIYHLVLQKILKSIRWQVRILIIGGGKIGKKLIDELLMTTTEYHVIGFLDDKDSLHRTHYHGVPYLGKVGELSDVIEQHNIDEVIISSPSAPDTLYRDIIDRCIKKDVKYRFVPKMFNMMLQDTSINILDGVPLIGVKGNNLTGFNFIAKKIFDITVSFLLILLFSARKTRLPFLPVK